MVIFVEELLDDWRVQAVNKISFRDEVERVRFFTVLNINYLIMNL